MHRIEPSAVPALFAKHDMKPTRGIWVNPVARCGCLVGILSVDAVGFDETCDDPYSKALYRNIDRGYIYASGLSRGWENYDSYADCKFGENVSPMDEGIIDGAAAALACKAAGYDF